MGEQSLDSYTFDFDPDVMDVPEVMKIMAVQKTHGGAQIFEWSQITEGTLVQLRWKWMNDSQYQALRSLYLDTGQTYTWDPNIPGTSFEVTIQRLSSQYIKNILHGEGATRIKTNVKMQLNIREIL